MAKSTSGTKKLNEALTPDQVSKVEDKYKSIYSGMLKGNKKKLMKYIDPKLKRPNPDAMAMGRAINLVKKETETVNEEIIDWPGEINYGGKRYVFFKQKDGKVTYEHEKYKGDKLTFGSKKEMDDFLGDYTAPKGGTQSSGFGESLNEDNSYDSFKTDESERFLNRSQVVELLPVLKNSLNKLNFIPSKQPTLSVKRYGLSSSNKGYVISMYIPTSKDDIIVELGKYPKDDKTDEVSISLYLPNEEGRLTQVAYETSTSPKGEELSEDSNVLSKVISMANQWYEKPTTMVKEEAGMPPSPNTNTGDLFSSLEATGKLEAPQGGASMVGQNYTLNGDSKYDKMFFSYEPNSPTPFGLKQIGGHGLDSRFLSKFGLKPTQSWTAGVDQFIFDGNYNPRWFDEKRFSEIVDHFSGGLSREAKRQRDFYKDRGQTSGTIDERLATLVKEVYSEKQRKWACAQDGPEFEEMCKDTAISKKKLKEEMTSTVSKARAKSELKQMLKGKRDDDPDAKFTSGKSTLKAVLAIDKDGKETEVKKLEDFDKFEKGTKFSLKETNMKNDRLTELIKAALTGPVKEAQEQDEEMGFGGGDNYKEEPLKIKPSDYQKLYISNEMEWRAELRRGSEKASSQDVEDLEQTPMQLRAYLEDPGYKKYVDQKEKERANNPKYLFSKKHVDQNNKQREDFKKNREKLKQSKDKEQAARYDKITKDLESLAPDLEKLEMFESSTLKEGIWSTGTVTQIQNFLRDIKKIKTHYYDIVGSDDVFNGLDQAERAAEEMMMNAPENRHDLDEDINEELATTPIKDDIYAIGSRIYKDPYEAISLVATDQTVVVRDFARKDKKFKAAVMDYVKSKGLETSVDRDGLYIDTKPLDFKGMPLMNEKSLAESIFKKLRG